MEYSDTQSQKRSDAGTTADQASASTVAAADVNNPSSESENGLVGQLPSPLTTRCNYEIEFMVRDGDKTRGANDVTILSTNGHVTQLKAERSGEGDDRIQEITFTASDGSGGEMRGAVAVRTIAKQFAVNISMMCEVRSIRQKRENSPLASRC